ncbi:MAG: hypothetical protein MRZ39_02030 [Oscillospiraceae bacterium]|nr:hypothetical protein [Oscillospiraceae bacterium]
MTALIIIAAIVFLLFLLFKAKIRVELKYLGGVLDLKVKYLCFTIFPFKEKKPKRERRKKTKSHSEDNGSEDKVELSSDAKEAVSEAEDFIDRTSDEAADSAVSEKDKKKLSETFNMIKVRIEQFKLLWKTVKKFLTKLFKGIKITNLMIDFVVSGEDACEAAVNYGKISAAVYNGIALLKLMFRVSVKTVDIGCEFESGKSSYDCAANVTLGLGTAVGLLLGVLFGYMKNKEKIDELGASLNSSDSDNKLENSMA